MDNAEFYKEMYRKECAETERLRVALGDIAFAVDLDEARRTASAALNQQIASKEG